MSRRRPRAERTRRRVFAGSVTIALLVVAVAGWALATDRLAREDGADPLRDRLHGAPGQADDPQAAETDVQPAGEPGFAAPAEAKRPLRIDGDAGLLRLAAEQRADGDGTPGRPIVLNAEILTANGADALQIRDTRLHVVLEGLRMQGRPDGVAIQAVNVTGLTVKDAYLAGHHTAIRIDASRDVRVQETVFARNLLGVHASNVRDLHVDRSGFAGNMHGVFVSTPATPHGRAESMSDKVKITANEFTTLTAPLPDGAKSGSAIVLSGRDHRITGNTFAGHEPGAVRATGSGLLVQENRFQGGLGHGIILVEADATEVHKNTFTSHARPAVVSFDGDGLDLSGNRFEAELDAAVSLVRETDGRIRANQVENAPHGISLWGGVDTEVRGNAFMLVPEPVRVYGGERVHIAANRAGYVSGTAYTVIGGDGHRLEANTAFAHALMGIYIGATRDVESIRNVLAGNAEGIVIAAGARATRLVGNDVSGQGLVGIRIDDVDTLRLEANHVERYDTAVMVKAAARGVVVDGGSLTANPWGIVVEQGAEPVLVQATKITKSQLAAVFVHGGASHLLEGLRLDGNGVGVRLNNAKAVTITGSHITGNRIGLQLFNSTQNLVYDNNFSNGALPGDRNVLLIQSPENVWNVSRTPGPNILGGPWLGGNHWHDYGGPDANADGLGDVPHQPIPYMEPIDDWAQSLGLPMGPFDWHPLVIETEGAPIEPPLSSPAPPPVALTEENARRTALL